MTIFHFPQHKHELSGSVLTFQTTLLLNLPCREVRNLSEINEGINESFWVFWVSSQNVDKAIELLEWVTMDTYELEKTSCAFRISFPNFCDFHTRSFYKELSTTPCVPSPCIPNSVPPVCDYCHSFDNDSNSCTNTFN